MRRSAHDDEFAEFAAARWAALVRTAYMLTGDFHEAEDLVQTTLIKVFARWRVIHDRHEVDAYVRRALVNTNISRHRRRRVSQILTPFLPEAAHLTGHQGEDDELAEALSSLTRKQRAVVVLRYCDDLSEQETARVLGCSVGTVKSQASRALAKLREHPALAARLPVRSGASDG